MTTSNVNDSPDISKNNNITHDRSLSPGEERVHGKEGSEQIHTGLV